MTSLVSQFSAFEAVKLFYGDVLVARTSPKRFPDITQDRHLMTDRFSFGRNWLDYAKKIDVSRILEAESSLQSIFGVSSFDGKTFLDIGSGSGLFSLAAIRLGAKVTSFDYDENSVACAQQLRIDCTEDTDRWSVGQGDILDSEYVRNIGQFDYVYSWGVLHHTGDMWRALDAASSMVRPGGYLCVALYNDQGWLSSYWSLIKRLYIRTKLGAFIVVVTHAPFFLLRAALARIVLQRNRRRGMDIINDLLDWLGGYPFETAKRSDVIGFFSELDFECVKHLSVGRKLGCNEFVFRAPE